MIPLIGYVDQLSGRPGDNLSFMVSSQCNQDFDVQLVKIICADPNPAGPGIIQHELDSTINASYPSRKQEFFPGSYATTEQEIELQGDESFTLVASIYPTLPGQTEQTIISIGDAALYIDKKGRLAGRIGDNVTTLQTPVQKNTWYCNVELSFNASKRMLTLRQPAQSSWCNSIDSQIESLIIEKLTNKLIGPVTIAAFFDQGYYSQHFNGKIEAPCVYNGTDQSSRTLLAKWDFSINISSTHVEDISPNKFHANLVNYPTRGVTGSNWSGDEMCWRHAPKQYAAIHFHEDDIYDFGWASDFQLKIPEDMPSGIYGARLRCGQYEDTIVFFVCPPKNKRNADICVLVSTFTYIIYGNHSRPDFDDSWNKKTESWNAYPWNPAQHKEYGLSTYNLHADGSGICHASHLRPLLNLRPGYITFGQTACSGLRHFPADSHLFAWLDAKGYAFDIITDRELNDEGVSAIADYKVLTTVTHPEYHTTALLNSLFQYRDRGGGLIYLGGNGFYWRIALHKENPGLVEIRRGEGGIRAWASEPGEYYNAFDGAYGGLWRRNARPPQQLVGVGFSAQGQFTAAPYRRKTADQDPPSSEWIFAGIEDEIIGDFGLCGGAAAGFELDRVDIDLGSPKNIEIVASSKQHDESFIVVPEEQLTHITNWPGEPVENLLKADMCYFATKKGGQVFSTGSITFCGSLPHNNFENNVSATLTNVINKFLNS